jgi:glycosyltransferase involved in cell wall biosynthesis
VLVRTRHISAPVASNALNRWLYGTASAHVVTTGDALRRQIIRDAAVDASHVTSVPTGIDLSIFKPADRAEMRSLLGLPLDAFVVVIVATLRSWKGHRFLLEAMAQLRGQRLIIVGDGPGRENLRVQVDELGLGERVEFAGHRDEVAPWLQSADVAALPSYANEGVPQSLMQAMACGVPVVTTAVGAISEIVEDGVQGLVVAPRDATAIANALRRLEQDSGLRHALGAAGLAHARERFSLDRMLDAMETVFHTVLRRSSSSGVQAAH